MSLGVKFTQNTGDVRHQVFMFFGKPDIGTALFQDDLVHPGECIPVFAKVQIIDQKGINTTCLLYTSDAADDSLRVDRGGRRIIKKVADVIAWARGLV